MLSTAGFTIARGRAMADPVPEPQVDLETSGPQTPAAVTADPRRQRRWWRLHFSTWCLVFLALAVLLLANIPGSYDYFTDRYSVKNSFRVHHGWPWTMLERKFAFHDYGEDAASMLWRWDIYVPEKEAAFAAEDSLSPTRRVFHPAAIAGNVAIALGILIAVALLAERRRRRRNRFWQVTLTEGLIACTVLAVCFALLGWAIHDTNRQRAALDAAQAKLPPGSLDAVWKSYLPDWWEALQDEPYADKPLMGRVDSMTIHDGRADEVLERLHLLSGVTELRLDGSLLEDPSLLAKLRHLRQLRVLDLHGTGVGDEDLAHVAACDTLVELNLSSNRISDEGIKRLYQMRNLESLDLVDTDVSEEGIEALDAALPDTSVYHNWIGGLKGPLPVPMPNPFEPQSIPTPEP